MNLQGGSMAPREMDDLRLSVDDVVREALGGHSRVAYLNFPDIPNLGDSAVWLGGYDSLRRVGVEICWVGTHSDFDPGYVAATEPDVLVLNGGGNFGDLWAGQQGARERLLAAKPGIPLVQLSQSLHFESQRNLDRNVELWAGCPGAVMLWRDSGSFERARSTFTAGHHVLSHDMAFALEPDRLSRKPDAVADALWLIRKDKESLGWSVPRLPGTMRQTDWAGADNADPVLAILRDEANSLRLAPEPDYQRIVRLYAEMALRRVQRAVDLLGLARLVVTDRLHGHVLATLLDLPQILIDNSYGKVFGVYRQSSRGRPGVRLAASPEAALDMILDNGG